MRKRAANGTLRQNFFTTLIVSVFVCLFFTSAYAAPRKPTGIGNDFPVIMRGVRPLGMGNAFTAMPGSDTNAQFYNPAAINDFEPVRRYIFGMPMADFSPGFFDIVSNLLQLKHELHSTDSDTEKIRFFDNFTTQNTGSYEQFTTSMPVFQLQHKKYFASFIIDARSVISLRNQAFPNFEFKTHITSGAVGGTAIGLFDDSLQIGGNLKLLFRTGIEDQITTADILTSSIKQLIGWHAWQKGFGAGADFGIKYKLPIWKQSLKPTISATVFDIADTRFTGDVEKLPMSVAAGFGIFPKLGNGEFAFLVDFRELNHHIDFLTKFHAGLEAKLPKLGKNTEFWIRGGCNEGHPAFGVSARWPVMTLDFSFYGEEAGHYTYSKTNYRLATQFTFTL